MLSIVVWCKIVSILNPISFRTSRTGCIFSSILLSFSLGLALIHVFVSLLLWSIQITEVGNIWRKLSWQYFCKERRTLHENNNRTKLKKKNCSHSAPTIYSQSNHMIINAISWRFFLKHVLFPILVMNNRAYIYILEQMKESLKTRSKSMLMPGHIMV